MQKTIGGFSIWLCVCIFFSCSVPENEVAKIPIKSVSIIKNRTEIVSRPNPAFSLIEGQSVILGAQLSPAGVTGGIHWQSSSGGIVAISSFSESEITVTGNYAGKTVISVMARNIHNEVYAENECSVAVIPKSFFKWSYLQDGWTELPPNSNNIVGTVHETLIRTGNTAVTEDKAKKGLVLEGAGAGLIIGSVLTTATNSPFADDPVYDKYGQFDFLNGPGEHYPFWAEKVTVTVEYEILDLHPGRSLLRIQVNNNTIERDNASAINNWLVTELRQGDSVSGILTGTFDNSGSQLIRGNGSPGIPGATDTERLESVLSHSFVCLSLPDGKVVIRSIRIESAD